MSLNFSSSLTRNTHTTTTNNTPSINNHVSISVRPNKKKTDEMDDMEVKAEVPDPPMELPTASQPPIINPPIIQPFVNYPPIQYTNYRDKIPEYEHYLLNFLRELIGKNKTLLAMLIEPSSHAIFNIDQLTTLIQILASTEQVEIEISLITKCCGFDKVLQRIDRILVNGADFKINYNEIYNYMINSGVSLNHVSF